MSAAPTAPALVALWADGALTPRDDCDVAPARVLAADSWLVTEGRARGLELHRTRFADAVAAAAPELAPELDAFWDAAVAAIPREGDWFPRVELREQHGAPQLLARVRPAPELHRAIRLATHTGRDPRTAPTVKGPDLAAMLRLRTEAQAVGADEAVLLSPDGAVAEGSTTSIVWWRGGTLCVPDAAIPRVDGVTARTVVALATALGIPISAERARPTELDGLEVWALNALHGIRIVTDWTDGPATAEEPGRLEKWRLRLDALRAPLPEAGDAA